VTSVGRVLVVDDDDDVRALIGMALRQAGYHVMTAPHGAAALDLVEASRPNAILLDMRMPVMDGQAFSRAYRRLPGPHAPIIVFTARKDAARSADQIKADGYVHKPFDVHEVLRALDRHARRP
jgi:CheY-like chemotaxis protein